MELVVARGIDGAHRVAAQANAARGATDEFDHAFASECLEVLFCGIGGFEAEFGCNFRAGRGSAGPGNGGLDEVQDLLLAGGEFRVVEHGVFRCRRLQG